MIPRFTLADGVSLPAVGFGTYPIENDAVGAAVGAALRAGYRHVDTAEAYGNEEGVGAAIRSFLAERGLGRDAVFVTTKVWPGGGPGGGPEKDYAATVSALDASLERLGLAYVDLYLIHAPFARTHRLDQWRALVALREQGRTRAIGVSNYGEAHLEEIERAGLPLPSANQIELHPWSQKPALVRSLRSRGIQPIAYSSLVPLSTWRAEEGRSGKTAAMTADGARADAPFKAMAEALGVTEAQVLLRWGVQQGYAVLPKSRDPARMRENLDLFSFALDAAMMERIAALDRGPGVAWSTGDPVEVA